MNTTLPILIHSVIGGIGEHPDAKKRSFVNGILKLTPFTLQMAK
ncbi:hypothetical protein [Acinetobacter nosocomialis]